jgi:uncharacterized small protein (DUF1192 family)
VTQDRPQDDLDRVTVAEAADRLGLTQDAVRKRVARGTIRHDKGQDGRIYVYVLPSDTSSKTGQDTIQDEPERDRYIASLEDQIGFLRRELERKDAILLRMAERIPELEPAQEPQNVPESAGSRSDEGDVPQASAEAQRATERSFWRRWFGGRR